MDLAGVEALGWVDDEEKVAQMAAAEIVCAPSLAAESFGIVLAEAMAAGVPVVASDLPGYRAVLRDGQAGRLTPPGDPVALADALYDLLQDEEERRRSDCRGQRRRRRALVEPHHRQHHRGLRGCSRGAAGARRARPAGQAVVRPRPAGLRDLGRAERLLGRRALRDATALGSADGARAVRGSQARPAPPSASPRFAAPRAVC